MPKTKIRHFPVLLKEFLVGFEDLEIEVFFDGTLGAAGHAKAILEAHEEIDIFIGADQDQEALKIASENLKPWMKKVRLIHENFKNIGSILDEMDIKSCNGIFLDLGMSSMQLDSEERGFSFRYDAPLDMRMNSENPLSAKEVINNYSVLELERIFREYGEEKRAKKAARQIVEKRRKKIINTTFELLAILEPVLPKRRRIHPATKIFQAIRICVNDELEVLKEVIDNAIEKLAPKGRIGIISFHSLEDRIVKHKFRDSEYLKVLTKKPIVVGFEEKNPRARSAKMRFAEKI